MLRKPIPFQQVLCLTGVLTEHVSQDDNRSEIIATASKTDGQNRDQAVAGVERLTTVTEDPLVTEKEATTGVEMTTITEAPDVDLENETMENSTTEFPSFQTTYEYPDATEIQRIDNWNELFPFASEKSLNVSYDIHVPYIFCHE